MIPNTRDGSMDLLLVLLLLLLLYVLINKIISRGMLREGPYDSSKFLSFPGLALRWVSIPRLAPAGLGWLWPALVGLGWLRPMKAPSLAAGSGWPGPD